MLSGGKVLMSSGQRGPLFWGPGAAAPSAPPSGPALLTQVMIHETAGREHSPTLALAGSRHARRC
jgi:hypothetical protein